MKESKLELLDRASGKKAELTVHPGTLGPSVVDVAPLYKEFGAFTFDPGYGLTAACESKITYIDGDAGVLLHRGYPVEQLAAMSTFTEVSYLLLYGELPTRSQLAEFTLSIRHHTMINETLLRFFNGFHHNAHPMAMVSAVVASLSAFYHDTMDIHNPRHREIFAHRTGKSSRIASSPRSRPSPQLPTNTRWASPSSTRATIWITAATSCT
jgi:citrate synthase